MLAFIKRLLWRTPPPEPAGLVIVPANIPTPPLPANDDPTPINVRIMVDRHILRFSRNDTPVLPGSTVTTRNNVQMKVARVEQRPPYVICIYRGRNIAVRPDNIGCYWATVQDLQ